MANAFLFWVYLVFCLCSRLPGDTVVKAIAGIYSFSALYAAVQIVFTGAKPVPSGFFWCVQRVSSDHYVITLYLTICDGLEHCG